MGTGHSIQIFQDGELEEDFVFQSENTSVWKLFQEGFHDVVESIIRPRRQVYLEAVDLGPQEFRMENKEGHLVTFFRRDLQVENNEKMRLMMSMWAPQTNNQSDAEFMPKLPCILYLHSNLGSRVEALRIRDTALLLGFTLVAFDFSGSGLSDGKYVTLGKREAEDVRVVCNYLRTNQMVTSISLYGHNMGAAAALLYCGDNHDPSQHLIQGMVLDSAFSTLTQLSYEWMTKVQEQGIVTFPLWVMKAGLRLIKTSVKQQAGFDVESVRPVDAAKTCFHTPALLLSARSDELITIQHSEELQSAYAGPVARLIFDSKNHFGLRPPGVYEIALLYLFHIVSQQEQHQRSSNIEAHVNPTSLLQKVSTTNVFEQGQQVLLFIQEVMESRRGS